MKKNKFLIITIMLVVLFSFKIEVNAAKELMCTYDNDTRLKQNADGKLELYVKMNDPNDDNRWDKTNMIGEEAVKFKFDTKYYNASSDTLSDCPPWSFQDYNTFEYFDEDGKKWYRNDSKLISADLPANDFQELTCLYEKKGEKNNRDVEKVLLIQDKTGVITIYKSSKDIGLSDYSSYWAKALGRKYIFDDNKLKKDSNGGLTECPKSKTTLKYPDTGGVEFFGDESGEDMLEESYKEVKDFLTYNNDGAGEYDNSGIGESCDNIMLEDKWLTKLDENKYVGSCLYQGRTDYGCHIIQLDMSTSNIQVLDSFSFKEINGVKYGFSVEAGAFTPENIENAAREVGCPPGINVGITYRNYGQGVKEYSGNINFGGRNPLYPLIGVRGKNMFTGEDLSLDTQVNLGFEKVQIVSCEQIFNNNEDLLNMIKWAITLVKILIPIALIGFGIVDFGQAVFAGKEDDMKKAQTRFIRRVIIAVAIFLIPSILKLVLSIAHNIWPVIDADLCGII